MSPNKEPAYFCSEKVLPNFEYTGSVISEAFKRKTRKVNYQGYHSNLNRYLSLFDEAKNEKAIGEATPDYLPEPESPDFIYQNITESKIIALLRNPFDTAFSDFLMKQRDGVWEKNKTFLEVLKAEDLTQKNLRVYPNLIRIRLYDEGIKRYMQKFSSHQVRGFLFEDLANPQKLVEDCFKFLEVSPDFSIRHNTASAISSSMSLYTLLQNIPQPLKESLKKNIPTTILNWYFQKRLGLTKSTGSHITTKCPPEARTYLLPIFTPSILRLQKLIKRDLTHWLD